MPDRTLIEEAYEEASRALQRCVHPLGMKASAQTRGYPQVWARDSMITLLGAALLDDPAIHRALRASITTLRAHQSPLGEIPNNIDIHTKKANFQAYADSGLWFIMGNAFFFKTTHDKAFLRKNYPAIRKALHWYQYQDTDRSGLVSMREAADWQDLLAVRDKSLYVNVLYYHALLKSADIAKELGDDKNRTAYTKRARDLRLCINEKFWYCTDKNIRDSIEHDFGTEAVPGNTSDTLGRKLLLPSKTLFVKYSYYLHYLTFRDFGERFDAFGNLLAIVSGLAGKEKSQQILHFVEKHRVAAPLPVKALVPPITRKDKEWRYYYEFGNLNLPHQYHNGGIWPFLGGLYVVALVKMKKQQEAEAFLEALAQLNKKGAEKEWEFNEWMHGETGKPMGMAEQAWSAGMYIYAYRCVKAKRVL